MAKKEEKKIGFSEKDKRALEAGLKEWYKKVNYKSHHKRVTHDPKSTSHVQPTAIY